EHGAARALDPRGGWAGAGEAIRRPSRGSGSADSRRSGERRALRAASSPAALPDGGSVGVKGSEPLRLVVDLAAGRSRQVAEWPDLDPALLVAPRSGDGPIDADRRHGMRGPRVE